MCLNNRYTLRLKKNKLCDLNYNIAVKTPKLGVDNIIKD